VEEMAQNPHAAVADSDYRSTASLIVGCTVYEISFFGVLTFRDDDANHARLRAFPPKAVLGPCFTAC
jgi:hypothetical protein